MFSGNSMWFHNVFKWWFSDLHKLCMLSKVFSTKRDVLCFSWKCKYGFGYVMSYVIWVYVNIIVACYVYIYIYENEWNIWYIVWNDELHIDMTCYVYACGNWNVHRIDCVKWIIMRIWSNCMIKWMRWLECEWCMYT